MITVLNQVFLFTAIGERLAIDVAKGDSRESLCAAEIAGIHFVNQL